ncbi:MAG: IS30 family transposase [Gammaproteobacteria bacterium]|nr:IS30 family transposase [Gammaproteobacteria bacterium]
MAAGRGLSPGGLESGAGLGALSPGGRGDGESKYTILELLASRTAAPVAESLLRCLGAHPDLVRTLTADSGKEFAGHREVSAGLEAGFCLATPCHSWERGLNKTANGLVRQYFPKGTGLTRVTAEEVRQVEDRLNRRPRKVLGCRTPFEVFHEDLIPRPGWSCAASAMAGDGGMRLPGLHRALQCRKVGIVAASALNKRFAPTVSPLSVHEGYAFMDRQGQCCTSDLNWGEKNKNMG